MFIDYYEDCNVGDKTVTPGRTITETDIVMFSAMTGDWNAMHSDEEYASKHTGFGRRVAQGLLILSTGLGLLSRNGWFTFWPKSLECITSMDKCRFHAPVAIQDTIRLEAEIIAKQDMSPAMGLITTRLRIRNQRNEKVLTADVKIMARRKPDQS